MMTATLPSVQFRSTSERCNQYTLDLAEPLANPHGVGDSYFYTEVTPLHPNEPQAIRQLKIRLSKLKERPNFRPSFGLLVVYCCPSVRAARLQLYADPAWTVDDVNQAWSEAQAKLLSMAAA